MVPVPVVQTAGRPVVQAADHSVSTTVGFVADILAPEVVECMKKYASIADVNVRFSNLAQAFLDKHVNTRTRS